MKYYVLPSCSIARNARVASQAIAQAAMQTFYPAFCIGLVTPADFWRMMPVTNQPVSPTYILLRDPVTRFLSALNVYEMDVATALNKLPILMQNDEHFIPQSSFSYTIAFQYETQLAAFEAATGLTLPVVNQSDVTQTLTSAQTMAIQQAYAADIALHTSIASASVSGSSV